MKKRINLLITQKKYINLDNFFEKLKIVSIISFFIILVGCLVVYYFLLRQKQEINLLSEQKKDLLEFLLQNKQVEAKFIYFGNKQKQLTDNLKEDVNFLPYYNLLKESLHADAGLESVSIDKSKSVSFNLSFANYSDLLDFLRVAENDDFLKNFNQLSLVKFNKDELQSQKNNFKLSFSGKFIDLNSNEYELSK